MTIEQKRIQRLKEELAQAQARLAEAEAAPKNSCEMLFALCSKVRGGKVASDRELVDQFISMLKGEVMRDVASLMEQLKQDEFVEELKE